MNALISYSFNPLCSLAPPCTFWGRNRLRGYSVEQHNEVLTIRSPIRQPIHSPLGHRLQAIGSAMVKGQLRCLGCQDLREASLIFLAVGLAGTSQISQREESRPESLYSPLRLCVPEPTCPCVVQGRFRRFRAPASASASASKIQLFYLQLSHPLIWKGLTQPTASASAPKTPVEMLMC